VAAQALQKLIVFSEVTRDNAAGAAQTGFAHSLGMTEIPQIDIVVPVKNEEHDLAPSVARLVGYLRDAFPFTARVTIADNGSTDGTGLVARSLEAAFAEVRAVHLDQPGRGRALHEVWSASDAELLAYMDVDLSTDLNALLPLVAPLLSGHSDIAIGTRLAHGARVIRGPKRELISRCYNLLLRVAFRTKFSDAQCGFKAIRACQARQLLPLVADGGWFFDTELLVLAERAGLRIHEVPVDWTDDTDSRVDIVDTALKDLRGIARVGVGLARGTIKVPRLTLRESVYAKSAALPAPTASHSLGGRR
jgi:glycosyltransferase involved in cell wall biosynthesis